MILVALSFLAGILLVQQCSSLPDFFWLGLLMAIFVPLYFASIRYLSAYFKLFFKSLLLFFIGVCWAFWYGQQALQYRLPEYLAGETVLVRGEIVGIPQNDSRIKRFYLSVHSFDSKSEKSVEHPPRKLRLSWYSSKKYSAMDVRAGEVWQFALRLKPPHGFFNPGGFDYEGWLFQQGVDATGYVYQSASSKGSVSGGVDDPINYRMSAPALSSIDHYRQQISLSIKQWLYSDKHEASRLPAMTGLITALAVGERAGIATEQWQHLLYTGTNHLMAISGLHIGLAYLFGYVLGRRLTPSVFMKRMPAQHVGIIIGVFVAIIYAVLAGLSIPTQRALIMVSSFSGAALLRRFFRPIDGLGLALFLVLLWDPLSVLSAGFWFSFAAVAVIFYALSSQVFIRLTASSPPSNEFKSGLKGVHVFFHKVGQKLLLWAALQLTITLALFPLSLYLFQQSSLVAPLANLVLVPYVSFLVVPVVLLALLFYPIVPWLSEFFFNIAAEILAWIWPFIQYLSDLPFAYFVQGTTSFWQLLLAVMAFVILFIPSQILFGIIKRNPLYRYKVLLRVVLFALLFMPLLFTHSSNQLANGEFKLAVLDVGQGLANVVQTSSHTLVFDSGARLSDKLDAGRSVVIPYLRSQGVRTLDHLIISHGDADHIGGAASILANYPEAVLSGQDLSSLKHKNKYPCQQGQQWQWDGVDFLVLHPGDGFAEKKQGGRNDFSCVLRVSSPAGSVLLTGDIEKTAERHLLEEQYANLHATVLVVAHHGSKTSSIPAFIEAVNPELAVMSAGYRNRYRLPNGEVLKRYQQRGIQWLKTGHVGGVEVDFVEGGGPVRVNAWRQSHLHYWNHVVR